MARREEDSDSDAPEEFTSEQVPTLSAVNRKTLKYYKLLLFQNLTAHIIIILCFAGNTTG